jgi:opacity protein-like surface antigen
MKSILSIIAVCIALPFVASAQGVALSLSGAYQTKNNNPGAAIGVEYQSTKSTFGLQFGFDFPTTKIIESVAINSSNGTFVPIKATQTSRINTYYFKFNYLILNEIYDTFFPYITVGTGLVNFNNTTEVNSDFDRSKYSHNFLLDKNNDNISSFFLAPGLGAQYSLGNVKIFAEGRYHFALSKPRDPVELYGHINTYPVQSSFINFNLGLNYVFSSGR